MLQKKRSRTRHLILGAYAKYQRYRYDYSHYKLAIRDDAVSKIDVHTLRKKQTETRYQLKALQEELMMIKHEIKGQKARIATLKNIRNNAKVNLDETIVYAKNNGFIQNLYTSLGAPIQIRKPIFAFVSTDDMYIQANFSEIDLRRLKAGQNVTIIPRIYCGTKIYHGKVVSKNWAASRQVTDFRTQEQIVTNNENNWILLPQRFPVQIKITDYDPILALVPVHTFIFIRMGVKIIIDC